MAFSEQTVVYFVDIIETRSFTVSKYTTCKSLKSYTICRCFEKTF